MINWPNCFGPVVKQQQHSGRKQQNQSIHLRLRSMRTGTSQSPLRLHTNDLNHPNSLNTTTTQTEPTHVPKEEGHKVHPLASNVALGRGGWHRKNDKMKPGHPVCSSWARPSAQRCTEFNHLTAPLWDHSVSQTDCKIVRSCLLLLPGANEFGDSSDRKICGCWLSKGSNTVRVEVLQPFISESWIYLKNITNNVVWLHHIAGKKIETLQLRVTQKRQASPCRQLALLFWHPRSHNLMWDYWT